MADEAVLDWDALVARGHSHLHRYISCWIVSLIESLLWILPGVALSKKFLERTLRNFEVDLHFRVASVSAVSNHPPSVILFMILNESAITFNL